ARGCAGLDEGTILDRPGSDLVARYPQAVEPADSLHIESRCHELDPDTRALGGEHLDLRPGQLGAAVVIEPGVAVLGKQGASIVDLEFGDRRAGRLGLANEPPGQVHVAVVILADFSNDFQWRSA